MDQQIVACPYNGTVLINKEQKNIDSCNNMEKFQDH